MQPGTKPRKRPVAMPDLAHCTISPAHDLPGHQTVTIGCVRSDLRQGSSSKGWLATREKGRLSVQRDALCGAVLQAPSSGCSLCVSLQDASRIGMESLSIAAHRF